MMNQLYEFLSTNTGELMSVVFLATYFLACLYVFIVEFDAVSNAGLASTLMGFMCLACIVSLVFYILLMLILFLWSAIPTIIIATAILSSPAIPFYIIKKIKGK